MKSIGVVLMALGLSSVALAQGQVPPTRPPQSPTYPTAAAQSSEGTLGQLTKDYEAAFNKGDAKSLVALYTADAVRLGPNNQMLRGRAAIEQFYVASLAQKPPTLTIRPGRTQAVGPDVALLDGAYELADGSGGVYVITAVQQGGQWRLAGVVPVPETAR